MRWLVWMIAVIGLLAGSVRADLGGNVEGIIGGAADRSAGIAGEDDAFAQRVAAALVSGGEAGGGGRGVNGTVYRQAFMMTLPVVEKCVVMDGETAMPVFALEPMGGQGVNMQAEKVPVVYGGQGRPAELRGEAIAGRMVALEVGGEGGGESDQGWQRCASLGAAGVVFLGDSATTNVALLNKQTSIPLGLPRFYCDDAATVGRFRGGKVAELAVDVRTSWQEKRLENVIAILPGRGAGGGGGTGKWIVLQARKDGSSMVMGRAPGATQALNAGLLLDMAAAAGRLPAHDGIVCVWTAGDEWNNRGTREFLDLLQRGLRDPGKAVGILRQKAADADHARIKSEAIRDGVKRVAEMPWDEAVAGEGIGDSARSAIEEELLRASAQVEEKLEAARVAGQPAAIIDALKREKEALQGGIAIVSNHSAALSPAPASSGEMVQVRRAAQVALPRWQVDARRRRAAAETLAPWADIRSAIGGGDPLLFISLALTAENGDPVRGPALGFLSKSAYSTGLDITGKMAVFGQAFRRYGGNVDPPATARFDSDSMDNAFSLETFFPGGRVAFGSDAAIAAGLPAAAIATLFERGRFVDTPNDLAENINWPRAAAQEESLQRILLGANGAPGLLTDPLLDGRVFVDTAVSDQEVTVFQQDMGDTHPRLHAAAALIGGESEIYRHPMGLPLAGTRRLDWYLTYADGTATFKSALRVLEAEVRVQAYEFEDDGRPRTALLANQGELHAWAASFSASIDNPVRVMLFNCQRLDVYGLFDPRYLDELEQLQLFDARRQDEAAESNIYAREGLAAVFMPQSAGDDPNAKDAIRWQLLASRGNVNNRMIMIGADEAHPRGVGFDSTDLAKLGPLPWRAAQDFFALDTQRKADLERFGISNEVIRQLHADSARQLAAGRAAEQRRDYPAFFSASDALLSLQSQEYQNLIDTSNGIIHGVIFLLLGVIPFSYFLERLLIGAAKIHQQIAWFAAIFALMTAGLWFHPAFQISATPMMILLAFLILILSGTVVYILFGKFEEEIARLRGSRGAGAGGGAMSAHGGGGGGGMSFRRGAVLGAAVRLGLSNMRRRGLRTFLTLVTLILLTFTLLCFTSVRETVQAAPVSVHWSGAAASAWNSGGSGDTVTGAPAGILLRQRAWRTLPPQSVELARELALAPAVVLGDTTEPSSEAGIIARRWWYASERAEQPWQLPVLAATLSGKTAGHEFYVSGLIGLDSNEAEFQGMPGGIESLLPGFLGDAAHASCWLPATARDFGMRVGERVMLGGHTFAVAGFFDAESFARLRQLSGDPLAPLDPSSAQRMAGATDAAKGGAESAGRYLDWASVAIVPSWLTEELGARLTSVMIRPAGIARHPDAAGASQMRQVADALARRSAFTVFVSDGQAGGRAGGGDGIFSINAAESSRPQDLGTVIVPMLIAGVIVLNTMLGAVAERTREILVYTSVGLSPAHVGMLFLAEAGALGTLGVVFGYIFGQGLATILTWTHLLPGVDLNYSSMSAIVTMGLVLGIVMLSALWPARAASRLATPSLQRDWKLPRPVGDVLAVDLPFTVNETAARGVCAFIAEYLATTSQAGTGRFTADDITGIARETTQGPVRGVNARIWLAPYDLGVIQMMRLGIHPTDQAGVFDVHVQLTREAGNPGSWRRLNRAFLVEIRRQFLLWRAVDALRVAEYVRRSESLFQTPPT